MKRQFTIGTVVFGILVSAVIALHANETRVDAAAVTQDKAQASPTKEERQHSRQAGPLLITVTQARHDAWKRMETDSIPGISVSGWGVTVTVKNTTDTAATVTIDPTALRIEDAEGKVCGEHPADAKVIAHAILEPLGSVSYDTTWGWKGEAGIVQTFSSGGSRVLRLVYLGKGTLLEFLNKKSSLGTLMTGDAWELTVEPQKSVTMTLVFESPAEHKPARLKWPGADTIDLP
jgi:hypothetical protein